MTKRDCEKVLQKNGQGGKSFSVKWEKQQKESGRIPQFVGQTIQSPQHGGEETGYLQTGE